MASFDDEKVFSTAGVTQTASDALSSDSDRKFILMQNIGSNDVWYSFGTTAVATTGGFKMGAGDVLLLDCSVVTSRLSVICTSGQTSTLAFQEG